MRHPVLLFALTLVLACSSAESGVVPPPPPGGTVPSVLAVQAGDGQQAEPGAALTVKPMVAVKDSAGRGVAGVTVSFTVDSGGGSLQAATATTVTDGTASPGDWHLGTNEGRNVMSARVAALASVKFVATAAIAPVTIPDQSVGTGGGTMTVNRPGSPINGMTIAVPAGAFPVTQTVGISYASSAGFPHPTGSAVLSPMITIHTSNGAIAAHPILITIPVTVATGIVPVVILRDPVSGRHEVLPTVDYTSTSVTAMTGHFNGSKLFRRGAPSGSLKEARTLDGPANGSMAVIGMPEDILNLDHDSGFRPGVDSWEFPRQWSILGTQMSSGVAATEAWYFVEQKGSNGNLWNKYQEAAGVAESNRRGIRWAALTEIESYNAISSEVANVYEGLVDAGHKSQLAIRSFYSIQAALTDSPDTPQMVVLFSADILHHTTVLVYRSNGRLLYAVDPSNPGSPLVLDFSPGHLTPVTQPWAPVPFTLMVAPGLSVLSDINSLDDDWSAVQAGTIGDGVFPDYRPMVGWGNAAGESTQLTNPVYAFAPSDPVTIWADCITCVGVARPSPFPAGTAKVATLDLWNKISSTTWAEYGESEVVLPVLAAPGTSTAGVVVSTGRANDPDLYWTDWLPLTVKRLAASIEPALPTGTTDDIIDLTLSITSAPGNLEYSWDFADGPLVTTTTLATTHQWTTAGTYATKVTARDQTTKQPVAKASVIVIITPGIQAWKFTSASVTFSSAQAQLSGYDGRWRADSEIVGRIANGVTQGGFRIVEQAFTPTGFPLRTAPVGLYLLEGTSLTFANLLEPVTDNTFNLSNFSGASLGIPAAPQVSGWNLVQQSAPVNPFCNIYEDSYVFNGTVTLGHLVGLRVPTCVQQDGSAYVNGHRLMSMDVDVTFGATTATGTISVIYYFYGNGFSHTPAQFFQRIARLTFTATRLVQ